jgi:tetratricopeptide (TPR) repeat protein
MSRPRSRRPVAPPASTPRLRAAWTATLVFVVGSLLAPGIRAQEGAADKALTVTASSQEAVHHFWMAWDELNNVNPPGAVPHLHEALSMDPNFGLARVLYGFGAPGLAPAEREQEIDRGIGMMGKESAAELLLALSWREWNAGRNASAAAVTRAAAELAPADPRLAFQVIQLTGGGAAAQVEALRDLVAEHPDFAPAYNNLAYGSWAADDHDGALEAVRKYAELRADHPNPHDSYAELLQWNGQYDEAAAEYRKAIEADASFYEAYMGLAELSWLAGKHDDAREHMQEALAHAPDGGPKLQIRRGIAHSWLMDGKSKPAMEGLAAVASDAQAAGNKGLAAAIHREMAVADAMANKGKNLDAHLSAAAELGGSDTPGHHFWSAVAYGSANQGERANGELDKFAEMVGDNAGGLAAVRTGRALVLCVAGQHEEALSALGEPQGDLGQAVQAECMKGLKRGADAKKAKEDLVGNPNFSFYNAVHSLAVLRVSKV